MQLKLYMVSIAIVLAFVIFISITMLLRNSEAMWMKVIALVALLPAIWLFVQRDTYLPFLGNAVFPTSAIIEERVPDNANSDVTLKMPIPDGMKIIYWGAEPSKDTVGNPGDAYKNYSNMGVTTVRNGSVTLKFKCPAEYKIPSGRKLKRHIHYRTCCTKKAMLGPVQTVYVEC